MSSYSYDTRKAAKALAVKVNEALAYAPPSQWGPRLVEAVHGCGMDVWRCYDDAVGDAAEWTKPHGGKARSVRNTASFMRPLTQAINAGKPPFVGRRR
jgi:hypothetical protein